MKTHKIRGINLVSWALLLFAALFSNTAFAQKNLRTSIKGIINSQKDSSLNVIIYDWTKVDYSKGESRKIPIRNGKFLIDLKINHPVSLTFEEDKFLPFEFYGSSGMTVEPGDDILIDYTKGDHFFKKNTIAGKGSSKTNCVREMHYAVSKIKTFDEFYKGQTKETFVDDDQLIKEGLRIVDTYKSKLSPLAYGILKADWFANVYYYRFKALYQYPSDLTVRSIFVDRIRKVQPIIPLNDPATLFSFFYLGFLSNKTLLTYMQDKNITDFDKVKTEERYHMFATNFTSPIKEKLQAELLIRKIQSGVTEENSKLIQLFLAEANPKNLNYQEVKESYEQALRIGKGATAFPFALKDTNGKIVKMEDFKGKAVLIDFMFTGCPGCVQMVPYLSRIEDKYKDKGIAFLSISTEPTINGWKEGIGKSSVANSIQLYTNGEGNGHPIIKHYMITSFPQLVLIDKEGKVVTVNAPDPRSIDNAELLEYLINEALKGA